ncbi:MAG: hypothetical protein WBV94_29555 [Blastocatellia bacterium]
MEAARKVVALLREQSLDQQHAQSIVKIALELYPCEQVTAINTQQPVERGVDEAQMAALLERTHRLREFMRANFTDQEQYWSTYQIAQQLNEVAPIFSD